MKQELPFFNGMYNELYTTDKKSDVAVLMLHGFPSQNGKNEYLAQFLNSKFKYDIYIIHYCGLGKSPGFFSFKKSIEDSYSYFDWLTTRGYKKIVLVGHSWGGLISLNLIADKITTSVSDVILLSPFNFFPTGKKLESLLDNVFIETKEFFKQSREIMGNQIEEILKYYQPRNKIDKIKDFKGNILIYQAANDNEVSFESTKEFHSLLEPINGSIKFYEVKTDHSFFEERETFIKILEQTIRSQ